MLGEWLGSSGTRVTICSFYEPRIEFFSTYKSNNAIRDWILFVFKVPKNLLLGLKNYLHWFYFLMIEGVFKDYTLYPAKWPPLCLETLVSIIWFQSAT